MSINQGIECKLVRIESRRKLIGPNGLSASCVRPDVVAGETLCWYYIPARLSFRFRDDIPPDCPQLLKVHELCGISH